MTPQHALSATPSPAHARAREAIALFEGLKGVAALASGVGLLSLLHHDLHHLALELIGHVGLNPAQHFPELLLHGVDAVNDTPVSTLMLLILGYVAVRWTEAYGLWRNRSWAEWLGVLSGGVYMPFELSHLLHTPGLISAAVLLTNGAMVCFLGFQLWQRRAR